MKNFEEQYPDMLRKYSKYWDSEEHDIDLATWLVDRVPMLIVYVHQLRGALGYPVPGHIRENPDILNGIADALSRELEELRAENKQLEERLDLIERKGFV